MKHCTDEALQSFKVRYKDEFSNSEYKELLQLLKLNKILLKRAKQNREQIKQLNEGFVELFSEFKSFLHTNEEPTPFNADCEYIKSVQSKASNFGAKVLSRRYVLNTWDTEKQMRVNVKLRGYIIKNEIGLIEFVHPDDTDIDHAVKVLWFYLQPEHQGNFYKTKRMVRLAYDCLLDDWNMLFYGTTASTTQSMYKFASKSSERHLLAKRNDGFINNLQRLYAACGGIPLMEDQIFWFKPEGIQLYLNRLDRGSSQFKEFSDGLVNIRKNRHTIYSKEEHEYALAILEGAVI
jgi:hypothetical protein